MPYRASKNCSELLDMTPTCPTKMLKIVRNLLEKTQAGPQKLLKNADQNSSNLLRMFQNVRKFSLLGIAVAGL
jgi:hypothetical protein